MDKQICSYTDQHFFLEHWVTDSPVNIDTHIHDRYELFYFISGDLTYYIEGQAYHLKPNDLILTNSRELHRIIFHSKAIYERSFLQFKPEYITAYQTSDYNLLANLEKRERGYFNRIPAKEVIEAGISQLWKQIEKASLEATPEREILVKTYFIQMLIKINNSLSKSNHLLSDHPHYDKKMDAIIDHLNKNLYEKITLDSLERQFFVNKYYICHLFKLSTGFTVVEYITYKRIVKAMELLTSGQKALDVAHAVGFSDYSTFYKAFKKISGSSPKQYLNK
ncbi:AraC family transcriptional regulator [Pullulanibacillus sp. KACC 23026]|uniref:AraC family transcriptional regulator n=1 Tax=Pullulanibacillus sp. KACC 23026 TaxID=3028315 RepID=UPI0023AEF3BE|nr:AraC family transcriptional regulator [Pullulanibacillus sp. KACC 23026]WEG10949.1 AraC family transcriptional regulator [Pullulanibacillus sp. KACC 23026]